MSGWMRCWALVTGAVVSCGCSGDKPLSDLFRRTTPSLVGPIKKLALGSSAAEARESHPKLFQKGGFRDRRWGGEGGIKFEGFTDPTDQVVQTVRVTFAKEHTKLRETLESVWGTPVEGQLWTARTQNQKGEAQSVKASYWFDPAHQLRAVFFLDPQRGHKRVVEFTHYVAFEGQWGSKRGRPAWMTRALLGSTKKELAAAYPGLVEVGARRVKIHLPGPSGPNITR